MKGKLRKTAGFLFILLSLLFLVSLGRSLAKIKSANQKIINKEKQIEKLKEENQNLKEKLKETTSVEFVEKQLRDNLGMVRQGEIIIILPDDDDLLRSWAPKQVVEEDFLPDPNWKKWAHLFELNI